MRKNHEAFYLAKRFDYLIVLKRQNSVLNSISDGYYEIVHIK